MPKTWKRHDDFSHAANEHATATHKTYYTQQQKSTGTLIHGHAWRKKNICFALACRSQLLQCRQQQHQQHIQVTKRQLIPKPHAVRHAMWYFVDPPIVCSLCVLYVWICCVPMWLPYIRLASKQTRIHVNDTNVRIRRIHIIMKGWRLTVASLQFIVATQHIYSLL